MKKTKNLGTESQISAINTWHSAEKSSVRLTRINFCGRNIVYNSKCNPDYRGTRSASANAAPHDGRLIPLRDRRQQRPYRPWQLRHKRQKERKTEKTLPLRLTDTEQTILDLTRKLKRRTKKIEKLRLTEKKAELRRVPDVSSPNTEACKAAQSKNQLQVACACACP